jgi:SAM-dependent methyltransferase
MPSDAIIEEMGRYYADRVMYHDMYMGYAGNDEMEKLLAPIIQLVEKEVSGKDVLEIACGTGDWTQVLSKRARSVVATDLIEGYLAQALKKEYVGGNVVFNVADAYNLDGIVGDFNAAFAADWWSHIPRSRIGTFIAALHGRLRPDAKVVMVDMMPNPELDKWFSHLDEEGNVIQKRTLPTGKIYHVIKNFPTERELRDCLGKRAADIEYFEDKELLRWVLIYSVR